MPDKSLKCIDCSGDFTFTEGEQQFYSSKGLNEPRRCKPCRQARKAQNTNTPTDFPRPTHERTPRSAEWTNGQPGADTVRRRNKQRVERRRSAYED